MNPHYHVIECKESFASSWRLFYDIYFLTRSEAEEIVRQRKQQKANQHLEFRVTAIYPNSR